MNPWKKAVLAGMTVVLFGAGHAAFAGDAIDAEAAKALAKKNDCFKCHSVDKEKKAPSYKKIAEKYRGKPEGQDKAIKNMTTGPKVKLDDGTEEEHKIINTKDQAAIKNLADWILSQ
jgi:cytochrome c